MLRSNGSLGSYTLLVSLALVACDSPGTTNPGTGDFGTPPSDGANPGGDGGMTMNAEERCAAINRSVQEAGFGAQVSVKCDSKYANLSGDTYPDHIKMTGITGTNDQVPVPAPGYTTPITLVPVKAAKLTTIDAALGVAVNGVPIYDYTSQGMNDVYTYDPKADTKLTGELDQCNGHSGRGDDYHYHAAPTCMIEKMKNKGPAAILGWGFDGYPIYGNTNPDGSKINAGELDVCNAKADPTYGYRYHTSDNHPYIVQCLVGEFDLTKAPRVGPLSKQGGGGGRPPGTKPPGGVTSLKLVEEANGTRSMTYQHQGQSYYITYKPAAAANCWDFDEKTYTTKGVVQKGTYCRTVP